MQGRGKTKNAAIIAAKVIRADGRVEDFGIIAGPAHKVLYYKLKRKVGLIWRQLLRLRQRVGK